MKDLEAVKVLGAPTRLTGVTVGGKKLDKVQWEAFAQAAEVHLDASGCPVVTSSAAIPFYKGPSIVVKVGAEQSVAIAAALSDGWVFCLAAHKPGNRSTNVMPAQITGARKA